MTESIGVGRLGEVPRVGSTVDEFDIDVQLHSPAFLSTLTRPRGTGLSPVALETEEITCQPDCDITEPPEGTNDCCEGGASIIPISGGDFTCDCPESAFCD